MVGVNDNVSVVLSFHFSGIKALLVMDVFSDNICSVEALFKETKKGHLLFMIFIGIEGHAVQGYMELHSFM
jgi:hypothetical protein